MSDDLSGDMLAPSWPNLVINSVLLNNLKSIILFMQVSHIEIKDKFTFNSCIRNLLIFLILRTMIYSSPTMSPIVLFYKFESYFTTFSFSPALSHA